MWKDPIVAEVHRAREKLAADCNFDIKAFFAGVRQRQASLRGSATSIESGIRPTDGIDPSLCRTKRST